MADNLGEPMAAAAATGGTSEPLQRSVHNARAGEAAYGIYMREIEENGLRCPPRVSCSAHQQHLEHADESNQPNPSARPAAGFS